MAKYPRGAKESRFPSIACSETRKQFFRQEMARPSTAGASPASWQGVQRQQAPREEWLPMASGTGLLALADSGTAWRQGKDEGCGVSVLRDGTGGQPHVLAQ